MDLPKENDIAEIVPTTMGARSKQTKVGSTESVTITDQEGDT